MAKEAPKITEQQIELAAKEYNRLILQQDRYTHTNPPSIHKVFETINISRRQVDKWVKEVGGMRYAHRRMGVQTTEIEELYLSVISELQDRIGKAEVKELIELLKTLKDAPTQNNVQVNVGMDSWLNEKE